MNKETIDNLKIAARISKNVSTDLLVGLENLTDNQLELLQKELLQARRLVLNAISYREARYGSRPR